MSQYHEEKWSKRMDMVRNKIGETPISAHYIHFLIRMSFVSFYNAPILIINSRSSVRQVDQRIDVSFGQKAEMGCLSFYRGDSTFLA